MNSIATVSFLTPRRLFALAAVFAAVSVPSFAADPQVQRLALSCASTTQTASCSNSSPSGRVASPARASHDAPAMQASQSPAAARKTRDAHSANDGSRFQYDSCGCSGS